MLSGHGSDLRCACLRRAQIPFGDGSFARVDGLDNQFVESFARGRERRSCQETRKLGDHRFQRKVARPDTQISMIGHSD